MRLIVCIFIVERVDIGCHVTHLNVFILSKMN